MAGPSNWTFITSHGSVLLQVARSPDATVRELAERAGLTERQAHRVLADLANEGYIVRERIGRRNHYRVNGDRPMKHPAVETHRIGELLSALGES
ncbi:MAG TPA: MarR family transcriptional regulator [Gaiellaceae bacterium]|nr:MarR family transcriptional regulator [Gaiellaceae bacterium]